MGKLKIPIVQIPRNAPLSIDERFEAPEDLSDESTSTSLKYITVEGDLTAMQTDFLFHGTITGTFSGPCDRCIELAEADERADVSWLFELGTTPDAMEEFAQSEETEDDEDFDDEDDGSDEDSDQVRYYEGDALDLAPHALEEMVLASPTKIYCAETCKGLCPQCGVNLNHKACDCTEEDLEQSNSGFNALKDMFPDLPSNTSEE